MLVVQLSDTLWPHGLWPTRLLYPWNSPARNTGVGSHSLLQGIFLTQGSSLGLPHCRQIIVWTTREAFMKVTHYKGNSCLKMSCKWKRILYCSGQTGQCCVWSPASEMAPEAPVPTPSCGLFPHAARVHLCDQEHRAGVMVCQSLGLDCRGPSLLSWSLSSSLWSLTLKKASIQSGVWAFPMARSWNLCSTASGELRAADSPLKGLGGGFQTPVEFWGVCNSCWLATSSKTPSLNHSTKLFPGVWFVITVRL